MAKAPRRRRRWIWLGLLPASLLIAALTVRWLLEPERLSAFLLRQASQATGLQLTLSEPAGVGFWPDLHLELAGLEARAPGAHAALLRVQRVDAVLPWSALTSDEFSLRSLRLSAPELDWIEARKWLDTRAASEAPARLPRVDAAIDVSDGRVAGGGWSVDAISLSLPSLRVDEPVQLRLTARLVTDTRAWPLGVRLQTVPRELADGLTFDDLVIELLEVFPLSDSERSDTTGIAALLAPADDSDAASMVLRGSASILHEGASLELRTEQLHWRPEWPALPLPASDSPVSASLAWHDPRLELALARGDDRIEAQLAAGDIAAWLRDPAAPLLPPVQGGARATRLQFGALELQGVELRIDEDAPDAEP